MGTMRALSLLLWISMTSLAFPVQDSYREPPGDVTAVLTAPGAPSVRMSPSGERALLLEYPAMPSIAEVARPMLRLAGMRIDPAVDARFLTTTADRVSLESFDGSEPRALAVPAGGRVASASWSHDSDHYVIQVHLADHAELWGGRASSGEEPKLLLSGLHTTFVSPRWMSDGSSLLCARVPADRGASPEADPIPKGPVIEECEGPGTPLRTYQDLLGSDADADLFDHHLRSELCLVDAVSGEITALATDFFYSADPSPDGRFVLEVVLRRPYSYSMPASRFPRDVRVRDLEAEDNEVTILLRRPLIEEVPIGGVEVFPRSHRWSSSEAATLHWFEALDGGDPDREVPFRDRVVSCKEPFNDSVERVRIEHRASGLSFLADPTALITREYDRDRRWIRVLLHTGGGGLPAVLEDRSLRDRYGDPGDLLTEVGPLGRSVVRVVDGKFLREGTGATPGGDRPFLTEQTLDGRTTTELWRSPEGRYEAVADVLPGSPLRMLTWHQTSSSPPNLRRRIVGAPDDTFDALTDFPDPTPQLRGITKRLVKYEREDGVPLSATLYLPAGYEPGQRLPLFVWAYPREFNDPATAGQVSGSAHRFTRIGGSSHLILATQGWAVLDGATMPIIGDAETMNDTFRQQLVAAAEAAVNFGVEEGFADRERVAVGGHSYGAFMTANLLAHSDLFQAGVARSGAYNRTLTPFGFQAERRTFWEAPDTYFAVSPFMHAHEIKEPLLLIHGQADNNSGTFPMQSERLFHAIQGHGGTARLVLLPGESHGYRARESVLHVQAETIEWLERHVKSKKPVEASFPGEER